MEWIARYWVEVAFGQVSTFSAWGYKKLYAKVKASKQEQDAIKAGSRALLRDRIVYAYNHYMDKGEWPIYARDSVWELYTQYRALGGNSTIPDLIEELKSLPTRRNARRKIDSTNDGAGGDK